MPKTITAATSPSYSESVDVPVAGQDAMEAGQLELIAQRSLDNDKKLFQRLEVKVFDFDLSFGSGSISAGQGNASPIVITPAGLTANSRVLLVPRTYDDGGGSTTPPFLFMSITAYPVSTTTVHIYYRNNTPDAWTITNPYPCSLIIIG